MVALIWFVWTLIAFWIGFFVHWLATRKQRRLLKQYQQQAQRLRTWSRPIE